MTPIPRHLLLLLVAGVFAAGSVCAAPPERHPRQQQDDATDRGDDQGRSNLPESVRRVERQTGGEVLRAEPMQRDGREVYRVKVLTSDGRVRVIQDDPQRQGRSDDRQGRSDDPPRGGARGKRRSDQSSDDGNPA